MAAAADRGPAASEEGGGGRHDLQNPAPAAAPRRPWVKPTEDEIANGEGKRGGTHAVERDARARRCTLLYITPLHERDAPRRADMRNEVASTAANTSRI